MNKLLEELATTESKIASLTNSMGEYHRDVVSLRAVRDSLSSQIEGRIDGIILGTKVQADGMDAHVRALRKDLELAIRKDIDGVQQRQPYYQLQREVETLQQIVERLNARLWQEKVDAALPRNPSAQ